MPVKIPSPDFYAPAYKLELHDLLGWAEAKELSDGIEENSPVGPWDIEAALWDDTKEG